MQKKSNRELNQEHEAKELMRVRPKQSQPQFKELEKIVHGWITRSREANE